MGVAIHGGYVSVRRSARARAGARLVADKKILDFLRLSGEASVSQIARGTLNDMDGEYQSPYEEDRKTYRISASLARARVRDLISRGMVRWRVRGRSGLSPRVWPRDVYSIETRRSYDT